MRPLIQPDPYAVITGLFIGLKFKEALSSSVQLIPGETIVQAALILGVGLMSEYILAKRVASPLYLALGLAIQAASHIRL